MTARLYVEGSLCGSTGVAGWGAVLQIGDVTLDYSGPLGGTYPDAIAIVELCAVNAALYQAHALGGLARAGGEVEIAMRSTGSLAVLRWVFEDAPYEGSANVQPPKRLKPAVREAECLFEMHDLVEDLGLKPRLRYVEPNPISETAMMLARSEMQRARGRAA